MLRIPAEVDMMPGGKKTEVKVKQYSSDFQIDFWLFTRSGEFTIAAGTTAFIRGTKTDGNGFSADAVEVDSTRNVVTVAGDQQMTAVSGVGKFELVLVNSEGAEVSTSNFSIRVERAALDQDTPASASKLREFVAIQDNFDEIVEAGRNYAAFINAAEQKLAEFRQTVTAAADAAIKSLSDTKADILAEMRKEFNVSEISGYASEASADATEAKKRASRAANYAANAQNSANVAAASATKAGTAATFADDAQASASAAAESARIAAARAAEVLALEIGRRSGLSAEEVKERLAELLEQNMPTLNIPNGLLYDEDHHLSLARDGVAIGESVTVTGGGGSTGGSTGTWGSVFGL